MHKLIQRHKGVFVFINQFQNELENGILQRFNFASAKRYTRENAPNPNLSFEGLRGFKLPLSELDACALISACVPQRFATGPHRGCARPGVWELAGKHVQFDNPAWQRWIQDVAGPAALRALCADSGSVQSDYILQKLLIHETGSQSEVEPVEDSALKIGNLVVVLPSVFTGGRMEFRHDGQTMQMDIEADSGLLTSVLAAYSGVEQTLSDVSGHRLSLVYDIMHRGSHPPALADLETPKGALRDILRAWKDDLVGHAPQFLACLLQQKYAHSDAFDACSLKGEDALLLSLLRPLAQELQFSLHLARIQVTVKKQGYANDSVDWVAEESICIAEDSFASNVTNDEDVQALVITSIVDLEGIPVHIEGLDFSVNDLINGPNARLNKPDSETMDEAGLICRNFGDLHEVYNRDTLMIWPESTASLSVRVADVYELAYNALGGSDSVTPTRKEKHLVEKLIQWCATAHQDPRLRHAVSLLRQCAERWRDFALFVRAMRACGGDKNIALIGFEGLVSAYRAFEWNAFSHWCGVVVTQEHSNINRWSLIMYLSTVAIEEGDLDVQWWCQWYQSLMLHSLRQVNTNEIDWLIKLVIVGGGEFLTKIIYPQLGIQWPPAVEFWAPFFRRLYQSKERIVSADPNTVSSIISHGLGGIVERLPAFPRSTVNACEQANVKAITDVILLCFDTDQVALCTSIALKMRDAAEAGDYSPLFPPWKYHLGVTMFLEEFLEVNPGRSVSTPCLLPFFENTVVSLLSPEGWLADGRFVFPCLTRPILAALMKAANRVGGVFFVRELLSQQPQILHGRDTEAWQELVRAIVQHLKPSDDDPVARLEYEDLKSLVVDATVSAFDIQRAESSAISGLIDFCLDFGASDATHERIWRRLLYVPQGTSTPEHVEKILVPVLWRLQKSLSGRNLDLRTGAFNLFAASVVKLFAEYSMVPKPPGLGAVERLRKVGCDAEGCEACPTLRKFVLDGRTTLQFKSVQKLRNHIERALSSINSLGFSSTTIKKGTPHTLMIAKHDNMVALGLWYQIHLKGRRLLALLGNTAEAQREILGEDYDHVFAAVEGVDARPPLASLAVNYMAGGKKRGQDAMDVAGNVLKKSRLL
ncbi:hypothetical protein FB451DRAFT_1552697 [Mycena latifolia]|nr:hypothetical protein FB451DRAFT_1552697 [Mycena latifolia]